LDDDVDDANGPRDDFVLIDEIKKYVSKRVPIVPVGKDGLPLVNDLYTPEEFKTSISNLSEFELKNVFRDPIKRIGVKPVNLLLRQDPENCSDPVDMFSCVSCVILCARD
jgi:hypothetical protein